MSQSYSVRREIYAVEKAEYSIERVMRSVDMSPRMRTHMSLTLDKLKILKSAIKEVQ